ncbi:MAG: cation-translocating P-type ATPase C-terminal domain-containing protein [Thiobacillaceae bacterium]|nr:cation-translocating P-type ATPase C-terminal domain-containing protein [Thiobacillaceae bacterium]
MRDPPRLPAAQILNSVRLLRLAFYGLTMMVGTVFMLRHGLATHNRKYALTLAFTTFALFQFFNVFIARTEQGSVFNAAFFANTKLWQVLAGVLALQVVVVHGGPAQSIFATVDLSLGDWGWR